MRAARPSVPLDRRCRRFRRSPIADPVVSRILVFAPCYSIPNTHLPDLDYRLLVVSSLPSLRMRDLLSRLLVVVVLVTVVVATDVAPGLRWDRLEIWENSASHDVYVSKQHNTSVPPCTACPRGEGVGQSRCSEMTTAGRTADSTVGACRR